MTKFCFFKGGIPGSGVKFAIVNVIQSNKGIEKTELSKYPDEPKLAGGRQNGAPPDLDGRGQPCPGGRHREEPHRRLGPLHPHASPLAADDAPCLRHR